MAVYDDAMATGALHRALAGRADVRDPAHVMAPATLGAARPTRYSFSRTLLRTAARQGWVPERVHLDLDELGRGEAVYRWVIDGRHYYFVAFTQTLDEAEHSDRVTAPAWEVTGVLLDAMPGDAVAGDAVAGEAMPGEAVAGEAMPDPELMAMLRREVPRQEQGRLDRRVLVLTRGNRSVRFFDALVAGLAAGRQPDPATVGDAGYIMRSTAFYGNGKFGMCSFGLLEPGHPFAVPYRAQFAAAYLFRELSYDTVEHCARARGGDGAVPLTGAWRRFFGLGNATGLGLVPFAFGQPAIIGAWASVREIALADVRAMAADDATIDRLSWWVGRARAHFATGTSADCAPFLSPADLVGVTEQVDAAIARFRLDPRPFDALYRWAEAKGPETAELVVSLLVELHDADDDEVDAWLRVDPPSDFDPTTTVAELLEMIGSHYAWIDEVDAGPTGAYWWVVSDNNDEPRRVRHEHIPPDGRDVAVDISMRVRALVGALAGVDPQVSVGEIVADRPELRFAVERVLDAARSRRRYGEVRDDATGAGFLPLQTQRFQLAFYGMDNYRPQSTDWLRVTLLQGAPRLGEMADLASPGDFDDRWVLPPRPSPEPAAAHEEEAR